MKQFVRRSSITLTGQVIRLVLGLLTSVIIARILGPERKGIYTLCTLLPLLIIALTNLGLAPASAYYLAARRYPPRDILGGNLVLTAAISIAGMLVGLIITFWFRTELFPSVPADYLFFSLLLIPANLFFMHIQSVLLGARSFREYNLAAVLSSFLSLVITVIALGVLRMNIWGALAANLLAWTSATLIIFRRTKKVTGGVSFKLNGAYLRAALKYGLQVHLGNMFSFLNYRVDILLVNWYLNPVAVGFYSIGVLIVERLWLISSAASLVLFPRVAAEKDDPGKKEFTPLVARSVFLITVLGSLVLYAVSRWMVIFLYSRQYLPAVRPLQILLPGIIAISVARVLANDISGRGRPLLNTYTAMATLTSNVVLNLLWIPKYGIAGAAWASTASYGAALVARLVIYCRLSGNTWSAVLFPRRGDGELYRRALAALAAGAVAKLRRG